MSKQVYMNYLKTLSPQALAYVRNENIIKKNVEELISEIPQGSSQDKNFLYYKSGMNIKIFDRTCDHNGGKLSIKGAMLDAHYMDGNWILSLAFTLMLIVKKTFN